MRVMVIAVMISCVLVALGSAVVAAVWATRRAEKAANEHMADQLATNEALQASLAEAVQQVAATTRQQATAERDAAIEAALRQTAVLHREQLGAEATRVEQQVGNDLESKKEIIDSTLNEVRSEVRTELTALRELVNTLGASSARQFGQVETALAAHAEVTGHLQQSASSLREALSSSQARGQWGERMAEDVLRLAGFHENVNYVKQTQIEGSTGRPDFTFPMPKGQQIFMDVKFPMASYLKYLEAQTDAERGAHLQAFLRDVRLRVRELSKRDYAGEGGQAVDYVLLFLPNEQLTGFIHEHDAQLLDDAMEQKIVLCSPLTLFAFLGVIRQAFDNFAIEQTSDEIMQLLGTFGKQWDKYTSQVDKVKRQLDTVTKSFDDLAGTRRRQLERPLRQIDDLRRERGLPVDGELFTELPDDDSETSPSGNVRQLGA